jgi:ribosomal protein S18 acetylase RimI-like enzyme
MLVEVRSPSLSDFNYILDIDLKCFDDIWTYNAWKEVFKNPKYGFLLGIYQGEPVGFAVWLIDKIDYLVVRLGVKQAYQHKGVGSKLIKAIESLAKKGGVKEISFPVPESLCYIHDTTSVSKWLINRGFKAYCTVKDTAIYCGVTEDEIIFQKMI